MTAKIILCSGCGTKNKIPEVKPKGKARCGNCNKILAIKANKGSFLSSLLIAIIAISIFVVIIPYINNSKNKASRASNTYQQLEKQKFRKIAQNENIVLDLTPVAINHGIVSKSYIRGDAPLEIKTSSGNNYYVKIVNVKNDQEILIAYIVGGRDFETQVPLGTYEIRYAAGKVWYGELSRFGPHTSYSKADELFEFTFDGSRYSGYTVELIVQSHGNLRTSHIDPSEF